MTTAELVPLCTMTLKLGEPLMLPGTPAGTIVIVEAKDGVLEGERLRGKQVGVAADWLVLDGNGIGTIDVRGAFVTDDGAPVYVTYRGRLDVGAGVGNSFAYCAPLFDTGDERYRWLSKIQAVGKGVIAGDTLIYELYELR